MPVLLLSACRTTSAPPPRQAADLSKVVLNQGYALLYSTVSDESGLDKALTFRKPDQRVGDLIKEIAQCARDAKKRLEVLARQDPTLDLKTQGLPEIEIGVRSAISKATANEILTSGGKELEVGLLLTQYEALNYVRHLAEVIAEHESSDANKRFLTRLAHDLQGLHDRVVGLLKEPYVGTEE